MKQNGVLSHDLDEMQQSTETNSAIGAPKTGAANLGTFNLSTMEVPTPF